MREVIVYLKGNNAVHSYSIILVLAQHNFMVELI